MKATEREEPDALLGALLQQVREEGGAIADVRSPSEFAKGAVAGAVNIPLFSDGERAEIGTLYKMVGREQAIGKGLDFLGTRLAEFVRAFEPYKEDRLLVYCARGGMRSSAVVGLLSAFGHNATQLPGGYKAFRNYALSCFEWRLPPRLIVIHGQTGVGKTEILKRLSNSLDLEACAQHRSSVFGAIGLTPRTQQQFDAHLLAALEGLDPGLPVWVEGESRKIGSVVMPDALRKAMNRAVCVLVTAPLKTRVSRIAEEYGLPGEDISAQWKTALHALVGVLGKSAVADMTARVDQGDHAPVVERLLLDYYDPRYAHAMRNYRYAFTVSSENLDQAAASLSAFAKGGQAGSGRYGSSIPGSTNSDAAG